MSEKRTRFTEPTLEIVQFSQIALDLSNNRMIFAYALLFLQAVRASRKSDSLLETLAVLVNQGQGI